MSDATDKVAGISHIPLFPLPLVLLPNELLPLHIFEPRYKQMLKDIELKRNIFGISFLDTEKSLGEKPEIGSIGCVAEVRETQTMPDERSNIVTSGLIRYKLLEYAEIDSPYFVGSVEFFEDDPEPDEDSLRSAADDVYDLFDRIAKAAFKLSGNRGRFPEIPHSDPEPLSFLVTAAFNLDNEIKYQMLAMTSTLERLNKLRDILVQAVDQMEESAEINALAQTNGHSDKKIDL